MADLRNARRRKPAANGLNIDRLPPHEPEAEQGVLGCCLLSPEVCIPQCIAKLRAEGMFYDLRHQMIWNALVAMYDAREPIDVITLHAHLKQLGLLEQIGGIPYLNALQDAVPSAANVSYYGELVVEKYAMRRMVQTCTEVVNRVYSFEGELPELLDSIERDVLAVGQLIETTENTATVRAAVPRAIDAIDRAFQSQGAIQGIATGFTDLDRLTDGLHAGEMIVLAGRPSTGKTSLAMNIAEHVAMELRWPVGVFSLEMTLDALVLRTLCSNARVNFRRIRDGFMSEADFPRLTAAAGRLQNAPLFIDDSSGLSIMQLRARARRMHQQHGIRLLIIDYLQLLHSTTQRASESRVQEVTDLSNGVKALAKELNIPIICLSQLNRELEKNKRRPKLSDLRESGAIEQDADVVGLLYRPEDDDEPSTQTEADNGYPVNLFIAKQRNGEAGVDVHFTFLKQFTRFETMARVIDEDVPRNPHND